MGLKTIFREGLKERKRRKSLGKLNRELKEKEKGHAEQLTALGQQAWESRADITAFADLHSSLGEDQKELDDLRGQAEQLQKQKQDLEERKKQENERLLAAVKEVEDKKRETDTRWSEQKNALQNGQKETQRAKGRLAAIAAEQGRLQARNDLPAQMETEKSEIAGNLNLLAKEEEALQAELGCRHEAEKPLAELAAALQEDSSQLQKRIDGLRQEQKQVTSDLEKKISALKNDQTKNSEKTRETEGRRKENFKRLGGNLAAAAAPPPGLEKELAAVQKVHTEMDGIRALSNGLDRQKDGAQVSAYKKMLAVIIGASVVLAAIAIFLFLLLSPQ